MKPTTRDYLAVLMAFAAVMCCGYGIGHLVGQRRAAGAAVEAPAWQQETLRRIDEVLGLRPEQLPVVEAEVATTAAEIRRSRDAALLDYHRHIDRLYARLIELLDPEQAARLEAEKKALERQIELLSQ